MPSFLASLWKSVKCRTEPSHVHDPRNQIKSINLSDLISHSKRHSTKMLTGGSSPKSIKSRSISHEVSVNEFQISGGTLVRKDTPRFVSHSARMSTSKVPCGYKYNVVKSSNKGFHDGGCNGFSCLNHSEVVEEQRQFHHSVLTELVEGDKRKIVERICFPNLSHQIETVLEVNNTKATLSQFEEHRATVKGRATNHHPRCVADGNELRRFHGATIACSLGQNGHARPCTLRSCGVCTALTLGFSSTKIHGGGFGVFTACGSERALEMVGGGARKGLIVCRVIAGRVRRAVEVGGEEEVGCLEGFDSLAGGSSSLGHDHESKSVEELYLLDPRAVLACFVVICRG